MAGSLSSTLSAQFASGMPAGLVGAAIRAVYPRVEPELARLASYAPPRRHRRRRRRLVRAADSGLRRLADRVVALEPAADLAGLVASADPGQRHAERPGIPGARTRMAGGGAAAGNGRPGAARGTRRG